MEEHIKKLNSFKMYNEKVSTLNTFNFSKDKVFEFFFSKYIKDFLNFSKCKFKKLATWIFLFFFVKDFQSNSSLNLHTTKIEKVIRKALLYQLVQNLLMYFLTKNINLIRFFTNQLTFYE